MLILLTITAIVNGLLAGASLDQSIEQLPARHRIGVRAYSAYSRASHLANGRFWLIPLGIGSAILTIAAAALGRSVPLFVAGGLAIAHTLTTVKAASLNLSQWQEGIDETALASILERFERWQALRASLQFLTFVFTIWALAVYAAH